MTLLNQDPGTITSLCAFCGTTIQIDREGGNKVCKDCELLHVNRTNAQTLIMSFSNLCQNLAKTLAEHMDFIEEDKRNDLQREVELALKNHFITIKSLNHGAFQGCANRTQK